jgi:hypothetical protein
MMAKTLPDAAVMLTAASVAVEFVTQAESWPVFYEFLAAKGYVVPGESMEQERRKTAMIGKRLLTLGVTVAMHARNTG